MKRKSFTAGLLSLTAAALVFTLVRCGSSTTSSGGTRTIDANTATALTVSSGGASCAQLTRDTSSCQAAREALGFSGNWLKFSCNVVLGLQSSSGAAATSYSSATYATITFTDLPDYKSNYWPTSGTYSFSANTDTVTGNFSDMYTSYTTSLPDPSYIAQQSNVMTIPLNPTHSQTSTTGKFALGVTLNGIGIYDSAAAGSDSIFSEAGSFDQCQGHPNDEDGGTYHYHTEPWSISYNDNNLVGIMMDGYWIYGRKDYDGSDQSSNWSTTSDDMYVYGGHVGPSPVDGTGNTFHYHITKWTACYDEATVSGTKTYYSDDGSATCTHTGGGGGLTGTSVTAYFILGHGNGGVFKSPPSGVTNTTSAVRYLYGAPGTCSGC